MKSNYKYIVFALMASSIFGEKFQNLKSNDHINLKNISIRDMEDRDAKILKMIISRVNSLRPKEYDKKELNIINYSYLNKAIGKIRNMDLSNVRYVNVISGNKIYKMHVERISLLNKSIVPLIWVSKGVSDPLKLLKKGEGVWALPIIRKEKVSSESKKVYENTNDNIKKINEKKLLNKENYKTELSNESAINGRFRLGSRAESSGKYFKDFVDVKNLDNVVRLAIKAFDKRRVNDINRLAGNDKFIAISKIERLKKEAYSICKKFDQDKNSKQFLTQIVMVLSSMEMNHSNVVGKSIEVVNKKYEEKLDKRDSELESLTKDTVNEKNSIYNRAKESIYNK